jgi:hypothetical protein
VTDPAAPRYARGFFDLQFQFAERVAALRGLTLERALLEYTNFYVRFGLGRDFDARHPGWRAYLAGLRDTHDAREWTYRFYTTRGAVGSPDVVASFGCFAYTRLDDGRIRLHFRNAESDGHSPLALDRRRRRLADLAALVSHVRSGAGPSARVVGASWLYNIDAYRRLFPDTYLATARVMPDRFQHLPLWGQFVDRHGEVRASAARAFLERLERQATAEGVGACFPFQVLTVQAPVSELCAFYAV